ncbi:MAG TPA: hypothetical protein VNL71_02265, partial [Chloroflexota bacterium]|nr:hypothetical protein [Chloroflexota bacterium]
ASLLIMPGMPRACLVAMTLFVPETQAPVAFAWEHEQRRKTAPPGSTSNLLALARQHQGRCTCPPG